METINTIELRDENIYPDEQVLREILGDSYAAYMKLLALYDINGLTYTWRYYKDGKAWLCKVQKKDRTIVWMSAWKGYMQVAIYVPEKLLDQVLALNLQKEIIEKFEKTKNVGKSKPCIFEIRNEAVLKDFEEVMKFKIQTK